MKMKCGPNPPCHVDDLPSEYATNIFAGFPLIATLVSLVRRRARRRLFGDLPAVAGPTPDMLAHLSAHDFEKLVAEAFRREGFHVVERAHGHRVHGVDLELILGRDRYLVHCRRWKETVVDASAARQLRTAISAERAVGGFIVTSGKFTDEARKIATGRSIRLVPAYSLQRLLKVTTASSIGEISISPEFAPGRHDSLAPGCPRCGKVMMRRASKHGGGATSVGWGCTSFPACLGRRED